MADAALTPGAYGPFRAVDPTTKAIFDKAMAGLLGVGYRPLIVASQVVAGTNYLFMCNAQIVVPGATTYPVEVIIFQPLSGPPHVTHIQRVP